MNRSHSVAVPSAIRNARIATTSVFFINGMALALFFSNLPVLRDALGIDDAELGTALSLQGFGTVLFVVIGSLIAGRIGTRATMLVGAVLLLMAFPLVGMTTSLVAFTVAVFALGASNSLVDLSMNTHASLIEREYRAEIMSSFHVAYNLGGFAGASLAGMLIRSSGGVSSSLLVAGVSMFAMIALGWVLLGNLKPAPQPASAPSDQSWGARVWLNRALWMLGIFAILALFVENAINGWSSIYLYDVVHDDEATAADAFAAFQIAMAAGRLLGTPALRRFSATTVLAAGGLVAAAGVVVMVAQPSHWVALIGFAAIGLGLANCMPMFFTRAAAAIPSAPALGIAFVSTIGYLGFICGPLALGLVSRQAGLKIAFVLVALAMLVIAISGRLLGALKPSATLGGQSE